MECELSFEPIFVSLAIIFRFKKLRLEFEMVKMCRGKTAEKSNVAFKMKGAKNKQNEERPKKI